MLLVKILSILVCIAFMDSIFFGINSLLGAIFDWNFFDIIENVLIIIIGICMLGIIIVLVIILFVECLSIILL